MMTVYEVAEAFEGGVFLLENMSCGDKEPRCWALVAAIRECVDSLDAIADQLETHFVGIRSNPPAGDKSPILSS